MYALQGKVALVTGAAGAAGLGRAIALRLAKAGAKLAVNDLKAGDSARGGLADVISEIEALGGEALAVYGDVSDSKQVDAMLAAALERYDRLDILVNNAAAPAGIDRSLVVDLDEAAFDLVQRVNVKGTFLTCRAAARHMIQRGGGGRIINISSTAGRNGVPRYAAYCASKFAVRGFSQALARELGAYGITVNAICPGLIATERIDDIAAALAPAELSTAAYRAQMQADSIRQTPLGRLTKTADIAAMACFLASDEAAFITGQSLTVDGGGLTS